MTAQKVKDWRARTKIRMMDSFGSECGICGYNKSVSSMHFHHINPKDKKFGLSSVRANPTKWSNIVEELKKCVLLCGNCHAEVHEGILEIPKDITRFNTAYEDYRLVEGTHKTCNLNSCINVIPASKSYCSSECRAKGRQLLSEEQLRELKKLREAGMSFVALGKHFGVSDKTAAKWYRS